MKWRFNSPVFLTLSCSLVSLAFAVNGCGTAPVGNVTLQSAPLSGPNAASVRWQGSRLGEMADLFDLLTRSLLGVSEANAAVSTFSKFSVCNNTLIFIDSAGHQLNVNGSTNPSIGQGLLNFDPAGTSPMTIGNVDIPGGTVLSEIDITLATVPSLCSSANYAVEFNDGIHGAIDVTQNTAFKFKFPSGGASISGNAQTVTLMFGAIVNGMVSLGSSLNNSTIQTVNVGQAQ